MFCVYYYYINKEKYNMNMFGPSKNHPIYNLMGFFATKPSFIEIKHLLVQFKTISAVLLSMIQLSIYLILNNLIEI